VALGQERAGALPDLASSTTCKGHVRTNQINHWLEGSVFYIPNQSRMINYRYVKSLSVV
jgi:hypothetical protein